MAERAVSRAAEAGAICVKAYVESGKPLANFMFSSCSEGSIFSADRKVSSSAQTRPVQIVAEAVYAYSLAVTAPCAVRLDRRTPAHPSSPLSPTLVPWRSH